MMNRIFIMRIPDHVLSQTLHWIVSYWTRVAVPNFSWPLEQCQARSEIICPRLYEPVWCLREYIPRGSSQDKMSRRIKSLCVLILAKLPSSIALITTWESQKGKSKEKVSSEIWNSAFKKREAGKRKRDSYFWTMTLLMWNLLVNVILLLS